MPAQGPKDSEDEKWMRHTISFSVGYFANDLLLILMYPQVCAHVCAGAGLRCAGCRADAYSLRAHAHVTRAAQCESTRAHVV